HDREGDVVGHAVARPGLEQVTARGAEELGRLPARERGGVQRIDHRIYAHQPLLEPGTGEHVGALAAGEDHDGVALCLRGPDRVPPYPAGASGDRDLHRCSSRDALHRRPGAAQRSRPPASAGRASPHGPDVKGWGLTRFSGRDRSLDDEEFPPWTDDSSPLRPLLWGPLPWLAPRSPPRPTSSPPHRRSRTG